MLCQSERVPRNKSYTLHEEIKPEKKREEDTNYNQAKPKHLNYTNPHATAKQDPQNKSPPNPSLPKNTEPHSNSNALPRLQSTKAEPTKLRRMTP